jgi:hypothetical protein
MTPPAAVVYAAGMSCASLVLGVVAINVAYRGGGLLLYRRGCSKPWRRWGCWARCSWRRWAS